MSNWYVCLAPNSPSGEGTNMFCIKEISIVPNTSASIKILVQYWNNSLNMEFITLTGTDYTGWGTSDNYMIMKVAERVGLGTLRDISMN
jgi:hypothetical protein